MTEIDRVRENLNTWMNAFNKRDIEILFTLYDSESLHANAGVP